MNQHSEILISAKDLRAALKTIKSGRVRPEFAELRPAQDGVSVAVQTKYATGEMKVACEGKWPETIRVNYSAFKHVVSSYAPDAIRLRFDDDQLVLNKTRLSAHVIAAGGTERFRAPVQTDLIDLIDRSAKTEASRKPKRSSKTRRAPKVDDLQFNLSLFEPRDAYRYRNRWASRGNERFRLQALNALPALKTLLPGFEREIDSGRPLIPAMASALSVGQGTIRWFATLEHDAHKSVSFFRRDVLEQFIRDVDHVPVEWRPTEDRSIRSAGTAMEILRSVAVVMGVSFETLVHRSKGQWEIVQADHSRALNARFLSTIHKDGLWGQVHDFGRVVFNVEVLRRLKAKGVAITDAVVSEAAVLEEPVRRHIAGVFYGGLSPQRALEIMGNWAVSIGDPLSHPAAETYQLDQTLHSIGGTEPLFRKAVAAPNGLWFVSLYSPDMLLEEATRMRNCIGKYPNRIRYLPFHALSIRDADDESVATVMLQETDEGLKVFDFQGPDNTQPRPSCEQALQWLLDQVSEQGLVIEWDRIWMMRMLRREHSGGWDAACDRLGFHIHDDDVVEWVYRAFHAMFVPAKFRQLSRSDMLKEAGLEQLIDRRVEVIRKEGRAARSLAKPVMGRRWQDRL